MILFSQPKSTREFTVLPQRIHRQATGFIDEDCTNSQQGISSREPTFDYQVIHRVQIPYKNRSKFLLKFWLRRSAPQAHVD